MKILFIAGHEFLYNPQNGGQQCSLRNYNLLRSIFGDKNVYLCMFSNYKYEHLFENEKICVRKVPEGIVFTGIIRKNSAGNKG